MFLLFKNVKGHGVQEKFSACTVQNTQDNGFLSNASLYVFTVNIKIKCNFSGRHKGTILMADIRQSHCWVWTGMWFKCQLA